MSDDTQIAKTGNNLPQPAQPQQPIQANLNQYGNDSTQIAYVQNYDASTKQTVLILQGAQPSGGTVVGQGVAFNYDCFNISGNVSHGIVSISSSLEPNNTMDRHLWFQRTEP